MKTLILVYRNENEYVTIYYYHETLEYCVRGEFKTHSKTYRFYNKDKAIAYAHYLAKKYLSIKEL